jgi:RNA polymerase sigma-70 factor (ECF subfamily)
VLMPLTLTRRSPARPGRISANRRRDRRSGGSVRAMESAGSLLVARIAAGDDRALAEAFDQLGSAVYAAAVRVLGNTTSAQDVVQDVFVDLWCHPERYDAELAGLRTYLALCARRRALDLIRSELRRQPSPGEQVAAADLASAVRDAVRLLPPDQREVVELAYFHGLTYRDVARVTGVSEGTAKSRVRLAFAKLQAMLDRQLLEST